MAEHIITGTLVYAIVRCAECGQTWEQPEPDLTRLGSLAEVAEQFGWIVCPHCIAAAPAKADK